MAMVGKNIKRYSAIALLAIMVIVALPTITHAQGRSDTSPIGGSGGITNPLGSKDQTITDVLVKIVNWMLGLVAIVALIAIVISGGRMIFGFLDEDQVKRAKTSILWAVIGLLVIILSYAIVNIVATEILGAKGGANYDPATGN